MNSSKIIKMFKLKINDEIQIFNFLIKIGLKCHIHTSHDGSTITQLFYGEYPLYIEKEYGVIIRIQKRKGSDRIYSIDKFLDKLLESKIYKKNIEYLIFENIL